MVKSKTIKGTLIISYALLLIMTSILADYYNRKSCDISNEINEINISISKNSDIPGTPGRGRFSNLFNSKQSKDKTISGDFKTETQTKFDADKLREYKNGLKKEAELKKNKATVLFAIFGISFFILVVIGIIKIIIFLKSNGYLLNNSLICIGLFILIIFSPHIKQYHDTNNSAVFFTAVGAILVALGILRKIDEWKK